MAFPKAPSPTSSSTQNYNALPKITTQDFNYTKDPEDPYSSSTEVGDDEKEWFQQEQQHDSAPLNPKSKAKSRVHKLGSGRPRHRSKTSLFVKRFRRFRWLIDVTLLIINISLSVLLLRGFWQEMSGEGKVQVGGDYARNAPTFPTKVIKFEADETFVPKNTTEFFDQKTIDRWNTMMPAGTGWGDKTPETTFFTTSMTHQLHCVFMMARIYSAMADNNTAKLPSDYHSHYLHCVDYLRQGIMCSGDLAMEPHEQTDPDDNGPMDGSWNGHHVCKDYSHIIPYLEEQIYQGIRMVLPIDD